MLLACDIDSTLYDADSHFARVARDCGMKWPTRMLHWAPATDLGYSQLEVKNMFRKAHSKEWVMQTKPYPGAADVLNSQAEHMTVIYVSDRHKQGEAALREWLDLHGFLANGENVVCTTDKRDWLREHRPEIVIDDRVRTIVMAHHELSSVCLSLKHNHNVNLINEIPGVFICDDWYEIGDTLDQILTGIGEVDGN